MATKEEILALLEPLLQQAEKEKKWLFCRYQLLWFSPAELRAALKENRFVWGPVNWELHDPQERLHELELAVSRAECSVRKFKNRLAQTG